MHKNHNKKQADISNKYYYGFSGACFNNQLHVAQWLQSLMPFKYLINANLNEPIILPNKESDLLTLITMLNKTGYAYANMF